MSITATCASAHETQRLSEMNSRLAARVNELNVHNSRLMAIRDALRGDSDVGAVQLSSPEPSDSGRGLFQGHALVDELSGELHRQETLISHLEDLL